MTTQTTQTTPETPKNAPQSLQIVPHGTYWQVIPPPPPPKKDTSLIATLQRLIDTTDQMAIEIEKLKSML